MAARANSTSCPSQIRRIKPQYLAPLVNGVMNDSDSINTSISSARIISEDEIVPSVDLTLSRTRLKVKSAAEQLDLTMISRDGGGELQPGQPVVFFCAQCRAIIGDSHSVVDTTDQTFQGQGESDSPLDGRTLSLTGKSETVNIVIGSKLIASRSPKHLGSSFVKLSCGNCKSDLGRMYKTTPEELDHLRGLYTYDIDKIGGYQLGSDALNNNFDRKRKTSLTVAEAQTLKEQMSKMQTIITMHSERITALEREVENSRKRQMNVLETNVRNSMKRKTNSLETDVRNSMKRKMSFN